MMRRPPGSTRTDTLFPYTTLFRSGAIAAAGSAGRQIDATRAKLFRQFGLQPFKPRLALRLAARDQDVLRVRGAQQPPAVIARHPRAVDVRYRRPGRGEPLLDLRDDGELALLGHDRKSTRLNSRH